MFSGQWSRTQRQSVFELRPLGYRDKFGSNELGRTALNQRPRNEIRELSIYQGGLGQNIKSLA